MNKSKILLTKTHIVGVIATEVDMDIALNNSRIADIFEWRIDCYSSESAERGIRKLRKPIVLTVRDSAEGGFELDWSVRDRRDLYLKYLSLASFIDVEAANVEEYFSTVVKEAKGRGISLIVSQHIFQDSWSKEKMQLAAETCSEYGGDIFKTVLFSDSYDEFCEFMGCLPELAKKHSFQIAPMAMGEKFGKISRLLFALGGSPLVYTYLSKLQVKGQWEAMEFRKELASFQ